MLKKWYTRNSAIADKWRDAYSIETRLVKVTKHGTIPYSIWFPITVL